MPLLHDLLDNMRAGKLWCLNMKDKVDKADPKFYAWIKNAAENAVCFDVGETQDMPHLKLIPDLFRLPYPVTWIEGMTPEGPVAMLAAATGQDQHDLAIFNKKNAVWFLIGSIRVVRYENEIRTQDMATTELNKLLYPEHCTKYMQSVVSIFLVRFLMALNCSNIKREAHSAPKFINLQRQKKGKTPIYSYWTLHLPNADSPKSEGGGETHSSPRVHLRRGHIRQFSIGRYTWVEAHVVGDKEKGMVCKDYALH